MSGAEVVLTGRFTVALPAESAYKLFTPEGERTWADGWSPAYPLEGADADDTAPGTVFETSVHGHALTTWIVLDRSPGRSVRYARVTPGSRAGTVAVSLEPRGESTEVAVTYELTALSPAARDELMSFAEAYPAFLESWRTAIAAQDTAPCPSLGG